MKTQNVDFVKKTFSGFSARRVDASHPIAGWWLVAVKGMCFGPYNDCKHTGLKPANSLG